MELELTPAQKNILEMVRWLALEKLRPLGLECDKKGEPLPPDHPFFKEAKAMGIKMALGGDVGKRRKELTSKEGPSEMARLGILAAEEIAYGDVGVAISLPGAGLGGPPVLIMGTPEQQERFFGMLEGDEPKWGAYALTEPGAGSDVARIKTTCRKEGNYYVLNGTKIFITNGARATWSVVFATIDPSLGREGHRVFVVEKGTPGFYVGKIEKKMGLKASETAELVFDECKVPVENLLGGEERYKEKAGFKAAMETFNLTRPAVAAMGIGIARAAYEYTRDYFKENYMLSRPIPLYHSIKETLNTMKRLLDTARLLCWKAAYMIDYKLPNAKEASMAKAYAPPVCLWVTSKCVDLLGAEGTLEYHHLVEKCYRDIKVFDIFEGTGQAQRIVISRRLFAQFE
jgi:acyl-CoA dehydrogenase